jgi:hypothetical protein
MHVSTHTDKMQQLLQCEEDTKQHSTAVQTGVCSSWPVLMVLPLLVPSSWLQRCTNQSLQCMVSMPCNQVVQQLYRVTQLGVLLPESSRSESLLAYRPALKPGPAKTLHSPHPLGQLQQAADLKAPWCDNAKHHVLLATSASASPLPREVWRHSAGTIPKPALPWQG